MNDARKPRKCQVLLLDERRLDILIQPRLLSSDLLDMVASHFNLREKEYFGLAFFDENGHQNWLRLDKRVLDHDLPRIQDPLLLVFCVRFFVPNISILRESSTIELFYLQARTLIFKGSIHCDSETVFELAGYALQASFGDIVSEDTAKGELRRTPLLPMRTLKEHPSISYCEDKVLAYYTKCVGLTRIEAILRYLSILQNLPTYGVHYYEVKDKNSIPWWLGLSPKGIGVYDHGDKIKPRKVFLWSQIENIYFRERKFSLEIREMYRRNYTITQNSGGSGTLGRKSSNPSNMMMHAWYTSTAALAKDMWTMAISQHQFYLDKKQVEVKTNRIRTLKEMAHDLSDSNTSIPSLSTSDSISIQSENSHSVSSMNGGEFVSQAVEREMVSALAARKEALLEKLKEKTAELKKLCIQEAELTGEYPQETPYTPGSPLPQVRRRVGTAFDFSDFVVDDGKDEDDDIKEKSLEVEIQARITSAAEKLAEDRSAAKRVRKTRKLTYQKSLRKLKLMKDTLEKLKQAKQDAKDGRDPNDEDKIGTQFGKMQSSYSAGSLLYRTNLNHSSRSLDGGPNFHDDSSEPPSPMFYDTSFRKYASTLSNRDVELGRGPRRHAPAFQYSDSDRSDCSTKPSSVSSSYTNSEEFGIESGESLRFGEPESHSYTRRIGLSWDNLNARNKSRSPSPGPSGSRSVGQSAESLYSDHDPFSPSSPGFEQNRSFSFGPLLHPEYIDRSKLRSSNSNDLDSGQLGWTSFVSSPQPKHAGGRYVNTNQFSGQLRSMSIGSAPYNAERPRVKYLNTSDLAIMSTSGQAGSYSVTHMGSTRNGGPRSHLGRSHMSTSMSTIERQANGPAMRTVRSHVDVSGVPFFNRSPRPHRKYHSYKDAFDEEELEWGVGTAQEATLV